MAILRSTFNFQYYEPRLGYVIHNLNGNFEIFRRPLFEIFHEFFTSQQIVAYSGQLSPTQPLFGVPQGSVLADLCRVVANHGFILHQYADDCQIYTSTPVDDATTTVDRFSRCVGDVEAWLSSSRLNLAKTQVLWLLARLQVSVAQALCSQRSIPDNIRQNRRLST